MYFHVPLNHLWNQLSLWKTKKAIISQKPMNCAAKSFYTFLNSWFLISFYQLCVFLSKSSDTSTSIHLNTSAMHQCAFNEKRKIFNLAQIIFYKETTGNSDHKVLKLYLRHLYIIALTRINMVRCAICTI